MNGTDANKEVVVIPDQSLTDISDDIISLAEHRIASLQKIITVSLKVTNEQDWVDQQGKPYLQGSGAEKVGRLFGLSWKDIKTEKINSSDEKGPFYYYRTEGVFMLKGESIVAIGTCSSKDQFFAKRGGEFLPISQVDETNIMKSSYTNCVVNGITRLLGLRNLTWDQLKAAGLESDRVAKVEYAKGGAGGGKISEPQSKRLFAILCQGSDGPEGSKTRVEVLKDFLKKNYKIEHTKDIERKDYDLICKQAEAIAGSTTVGA